MSIDVLQHRIRKLKNPSVIDFNVLPEHIPPQLLAASGNISQAYEAFVCQLLDALKTIVPAVRFNFGQFMCFGLDGGFLLSQLLQYAKACGYYIFLDIPDPRSQMDAQRSAQMLFSENSNMCFDALILSAYIGSDAIKPIIETMRDNDKDVFVVVRTSNRSAQELQDLLSGSRLVHMAMADIVNRFCEPMIEKCGYSRVAAVASAASADSLRNLRTKYKSMFLLLDGYDYPNANAKNCSFAFDKLGHGSIACAGLSVTAAWRQWPEGAGEFIPATIEAAERMKRNLLRYITIL